MSLALKLGMTIQEFKKSTERELYNFITARDKAIKEQRTHEWDIARHIMLPGMQQLTEKKLRVRDIIHLDHDTDRKELTEWENQWLKDWNKQMDEGPRAIIPN